MISDVCGGQTRTTLSCENCGNRKVLFEIFNNLSLSIPAKMEIPLNITALLLNGTIVQIAVSISKFAKISELIVEISKIILVPSDSLYLAEYYPGSNLIVLNRYENDPLLRIIRENSNLFAYEVINSLDVAEKLGKKYTKYSNQSAFKVFQHVDVCLTKDS